MLDDRERELLLDIERRLQLEDPALLRFFDGVRHTTPAEHGRVVDVAATFAGITLWTVLHLGPVPVPRSEAEAFDARDRSTIGRAAPGEPGDSSGPASPVVPWSPLQTPIDTHRKGDPE